MEKRRLLAFDLLRGFAVVLVLFAHLHYYVPDIPFWEWTADYFAIFGLGLFVFVSGFLLAYTRELVPLRSTVLPFYHRRFMRIFPLYWLALLAYLVFFSLVAPLFDPRASLVPLIGPGDYLNLVIHILGLQVVFAPAYADPMLFWFVGFIVLCYLIYPFIMTRPKSLGVIVATSLLFCLVFAVLRARFGLIGDSVFGYFSVFVVGILYRLRYTERAEWSRRADILLVVGGVASLLLYAADYQAVPYLSAIPGGLGTLLRLLSLNVLIVTATLITTRVSQWLVRFRSVIEHAKYIEIASISSYCAYLFQAEIFVIITGVDRYLGLSSVLHQVILIVLGIPLIILLSYLLQRSADRALRRLDLWASAGK